MQYLGLTSTFLTTMMCVSTAQAGASTQRCKAHKAITAPTNSFAIDLKRNVVTKDGLMWKRCAEGQSTSTRKGCEGKADQIYFEQAISDKKYKKFAGYSDWRLPSIDEVKSILEKSCKGPAFNLDVFPASPNFKLWSQSKVEGNDSQVWIMFSSTGTAIKSRIASPAMLRLVRDVK